MEYIERESFLEQKREQYCKDCARRKGMKNGKYKTLYEIGEAPCRACDIDDMLNDVEDFPAAEVRPVVRGKWIPVIRYMDNTVVGWSCSVCGFEIDVTEDGFNYCPKCGADLGGSVKHEQKICIPAQDRPSEPVHGKPV